MSALPALDTLALGNFKADLGWGDVFFVVAALSSGLWTLVLLWREVRNLERTNRSAHYSELDRNYTDILLQALDRPYLRDPTRIAKYVDWLAKRENGECDEKNAWSDPELAKEAPIYDTYALVTMNFIETIRDRCHESSGTSWLRSKKGSRGRLVTTWKPIIASECDLHLKWFLNDTLTSSDLKSTRKFCLGFVDFVIQRGWTNPAHTWGDGSRWQRKSALERCRLVARSRAQERQPQLRTTTST